MTRLRIRAHARSEIAEALDWYLARSQVAAAAFLTELQVAMNRIAESPEQFPVVRGHLRRVLLRRFPYAVYHKIFKSGVSVVGVLHGNRHPATWLRRAEP